MNIESLIEQLESEIENLSFLELKKYYTIISSLHSIMNYAILYKMTKKESIENDCKNLSKVDSLLSIMKKRIYVYPKNAKFKKGGIVCSVNVDDGKEFIIPNIKRMSSAKIVKQNNNGKTY